MSTNKLAEFLYFYFLGCVWGMWKEVPGPGIEPANLSHSNDSSCCSDNARSLTCWDTRELRCWDFWGCFFFFTLEINWGRTDIFTTLSLLVHECGRFLQVFRFSLISCIGILQFSSYRFSTLVFARFIPKCFFLFEAIKTVIHFWFWCLLVHCQYLEMKLIF